MKQFLFEVVASKTFYWFMTIPLCVLVICYRSLAKPFGRWTTWDMLFASGLGVAISLVVQFLLLFLLKP